MVNIYLITGFLGAGKTSFLNQQLKLTKRKVGVLMNEFGAISMDTVAIDHEDESFIELKNGSIFCACLKENFISGISRLVTQDIEDLFIEASGLSDPSDMGKVLQVVDSTVEGAEYNFKGTICLIDGMYFFQELDKMVSVERQIRHSHYIVINKCDLIDDVKINAIEAKLIELNPKATIVRAVSGKIDAEDLQMDTFYIEDEETTNKVDNKPKNLVVHFTETVDRAELTTFLEALTDHFFRIKGYLTLEGQMHKVDTVNSQIVMEAFEGDVLVEAEERLVCLASKGIISVSKIATEAGRVFKSGYELKS